MSVDDIKLTVWDFAIDKVTENQTVMLQRFFIRQYCLWMPLRAIAEATGSEDHTRVVDAIRSVRANQKLYTISQQLKQILDAKLHGRDVNRRSVRFYSDYKSRRKEV